MEKIEIIKDDTYIYMCVCALTDALHHTCVIIVYEKQKKEKKKPKRKWFMGGLRHIDQRPL